jgi:hypothetical protein
VALKRADFGPRRSHCAAVVMFRPCLADLSVAEICALVDSPPPLAGGLVVVGKVPWMVRCPVVCLLLGARSFDCLALYTVAVTACASG